MIFIIQFKNYSDPFLLLLTTSLALKSQASSTKNLDPKEIAIGIHLLSLPPASVAGPPCSLQELYLQ